MAETSQHASHRVPRAGAAAAKGKGGAAGASGGTGTVSRRVLPYVPVALGIAAQVALGGGPGPTTATDAAVACGEGIASYAECHSQYKAGCSPNHKYDAYLNELKNQDVAPTTEPERFFTSQQDFANLEKNTPSDLTAQNHAQHKDVLAAPPLGETHVVGLVGYLNYAKPGGPESSNCELTGAEDIDFHIGIGFDESLRTLAVAQAGKKSPPRELTHSAVIVEMTPHWRAAHRPQWNLDAIYKQAGKQVRVVGQLLVDNDHYQPNADCGRADADPKSCWRGSVWELHPVTRFEVCETGTCTEKSGDWVPLEKLAPAAAPAASAAAAPAAGEATGRGAAPPAQPPPGRQPGGAAPPSPPVR
jgi:hypothetical protein